MEYFSNEFFLIALTFGTYFLGKLLRRWTGCVPEGNRREL